MEGTERGGESSQKLAFACAIEGERPPGFQLGASGSGRAGGDQGCEQSGQVEASEGTVSREPQPPTQALLIGPQDLWLNKTIPWARSWAGPQVSCSQAQREEGGPLASQAATWPAQTFPRAPG